MFANRFTAFVDACCLAGALKRDLLLTLAQAEFFRIRWSVPVLEETEEAVRRMVAARGGADPAAHAAAVRRAMADAFEEACVTGFDIFLPAAAALPDGKDRHVLAAALRTRADILVTDNLRHFPAAVLARLGLEARSADDFLADTIALHPGRAVAAIRARRESYRRPALTAEELLRRMEARSLLATADALRPHRASL